MLHYCPRTFPVEDCLKSAYNLDVRAQEGFCVSEVKAHYVSVTVLKKDSHIVLRKM